MVDLPTNFNHMSTMGQGYFQDAFDSVTVLV